MRARKTESKFNLPTWLVPGEVDMEVDEAAPSGAGRAAVQKSNIGLGKLLVLGLGFFTTQISWSFYNSYVPVWLRQLLPSDLAVGFIMTLDNIAMVITEPLIGAWSDKLDTRFGRRMPFLLVGIPCAALFFALLPLGEHHLPTLIPLLLGFLISMALYRAPVVALMPDLIPAANRSNGNAAINLMGGLGSVFSNFLSPTLIAAGGASLAFRTGAATMIVALVILACCINEKRDRLQELPAAREAGSPMQLLKRLWSSKKEDDRSCRYLLLAIFAWFLGEQAIVAFYTLWAVHVIPELNTLYSAGHIDQATAMAQSAMASWSTAYLLCALPSGLFGTRIGRKPALMTGVVILTLGFLFCPLFASIPALRILLGAVGVGWSLIIVNSIVIVWQLAPAGCVGAYTGLYYLHSSMAAIVGPILFGGLVDMLKWMFALQQPAYFVIFPGAVVCLCAAFFLLCRVSRGEADDVLDEDSLHEDDGSALLESLDSSGSLELTPIGAAADIEELVE